MYALYFTVRFDKRFSKEATFILHYFAIVQSDIGDDLDNSITSALKTAAELKKMSNKMKASLKDELSRSYRDSSLLSTFLD